jgi:Zn-dependent protease
MRLWPFRQQAARYTVSGIPPDALLVTEDALRRNVEDLFVVRAQELRGAAICLGGELRMEPARALPLLEARFKPFGYTPFLGREGDVTWIRALPLADVRVRSRVWVNALLFILTCVTTLAAGLIYAGSPTFDALRRDPGLIRFLAGIPFAATLMGVLVVHEFGHYFTARHYGASVSLPYFIPIPTFLGTLGAVIRMRSPARDRNSLFDIAVAGPLAGLAVAFPAVIVGLSWSRVIPAPVGGEAFGFGDSLLFAFLRNALVGPIPDGMILYTHPVADAAWVGLFVTAINLLPIGQLDGGRIAYALFGRRHRSVSIAAFIGLLVLGVVAQSINWLVLAALVFLLVGFYHAPPLDDLTPLSPARYAIGVLCLILVVLLIPPVPIAIPGQ